MKIKFQRGLAKVNVLQRLALFCFEQIWRNIFSQNLISSKLKQQDLKQKNRWARCPCSTCCDDLSLWMFFAAVSPVALQQFHIHMLLHDNDSNLVDNNFIPTVYVGHGQRWACCEMFSEKMLEMFSWFTKGKILRKSCTISGPNAQTWLSCCMKNVSKDGK